MLYRTNWLLPMAAVFLLAGVLSMGLPATTIAQLPNLTYYQDPNFTYPLVPTATAVGTWPVTLPATLPGNAGSIYLSFTGQNNGSGDVPDGFVGINQLDGSIIDTWDYWFFPAGSIYTNYGQGPFNVRGGRHTLDVVNDPYNAVIESDETDNAWGHQFVFTPYVLSESTPKMRGAPPAREGGWSSIIDGSLITTNCDGFRFNSSGWWNVITLYADDDADDYDLDLYPPATGSEDGFSSFIEDSMEFPGHLDAIIINRNTVGFADYDIGVTNYNDGGGQFVIEQVISQPSFVGDLLTVDLAANEYLRIWDTWIGDTGWVSVFVEDVAAAGEGIFVGWVEHDATEVGLSDINDWAVTDESGRAWLHRDFTTVGYYGLVIYRDPIDGGVAKTVTVKIEPTPPDLRPYQLTGWYAPLVPTPTPVVLGSPVILPDTLYGFMSETYLNFAVENFSEASSPPVDVAIYQDGWEDYPAHVVTTQTIYPFEVWAWNFQSGLEFPGGRHVLTLEADHIDSIHEIYEDNNIWGEQFCWSPLDLDFGNQFSHEHPGIFSGGWETITSGESLLINCDGYRLHTGSYYWEGLVLTQGQNSDFDLFVHHSYSGVKDGFDDYLASSTLLAGATDYILINNNVMPAGAFDIGVANDYGDEPYTVEAVGSTTLPPPSTGTHGPYEMLVSHMLHIHDLYLDQGMYAFRLDNVAGGVDWGFALHSCEDGLMGRSNAMLGGESWWNGPGQAEWFTVDIPTAGWHALAVFKAGPEGFDLDGAYQLTIMEGVSDVHDPVNIPSATALTGVHPNPFNPQTTINYELAVPASVELDIYDVKGALVRRLVRESMPAGHHAAVWNGKDDTGGRAASGVYLARFSAGNHRDVRKLVMLK